MGSIISRTLISNSNQNNFKEFSLKNVNTYCRVLSVYDGDTLTIGYKYLNKYFKSKIRMLGYDSPEMKPSKNSPTRDEEKRKAVLAKEFIVELTKDKILWVEFKEFDKYGRPLANLYIINYDLCFSLGCMSNKVSINQLMIQNGHGYIYDGGTKQKFGETKV